MKKLKFAILGTGFWSRFQLAAWRELSGVECVALYNRTRAKAQRLGDEFGIKAVYDDAEQLLENEDLDFVDIITDVDTHITFSNMASERGLAVICQKPLAPSFKDARELARSCRERGTRLLVHENFRWQRPIRAVKHILESGKVGNPYRAQIDFRSSFPVFDNQPFLSQLERFILTDVGSHILDVVRFLFGEASSMYCRIHRYHQAIRGEDVATVVLGMESGATVVCNLGYATPLKDEAFPQTLIHVEGNEGSLDLEKDYRMSLTTRQGVTEETYPPKHYDWVDPAYAVVHSSIVDCNRNMLAGMQAAGKCETTAEDNIKTLQLIEAAYSSVAANQAIEITPFKFS